MRKVNVYAVKYQRNDWNADTTEINLAAPTLPQAVERAGRWLNKIGYRGHIIQHVQQFGEIIVEKN